MSSANDKKPTIKEMMDDNFNNFKKQLLIDKHETYIQAANKLGDISKTIDKLDDILEKKDKPGDISKKIDKSSVKKAISLLKAEQARSEPIVEEMQEQFQALNRGEDHVIGKLRRKNLDSLDKAMIKQKILKVNREAAIRHYAKTYVDPLIEAYKKEEEYPESLTFGGKTKRRRRKKTTTRKRKRGKKNRK